MCIRDSRRRRWPRCDTHIGAPLSGGVAGHGVPLCRDAGGHIVFPAVFVHGVHGLVAAAEAVLIDAGRKALSLIHICGASYEGVYYLSIHENGLVEINDVIVSIDAPLQIAGYCTYLGTTELGMVCLLYTSRCV